MLKNFVNSGPVGSLITIQDDNSIKGSNLFKALLKADTQDQTVRKIHLLCFENPPEYYITTDSTKVVMYDFFKDPCCWTQRNELNSSQLCNKLLEEKDVTSVVYIDSINMLLCLEDVKFVCNFMNNLRDCFKNVKCILHEDMLESNGVIDKINFFINIILRLYIKTTGEKNIFVDGVYKKVNGKVVKLKATFNIDNDFNIHSQACDTSKKTVTTSNINKMNNLTTFRLGLDMKENEKIARDNLVLPYLRSKSQKPANEEGTIIYYAESGDDDEEDPDEDLDI